MIKVTRAMINAAHEVTLANHEIALSAAMLTKIYTAMSEVAERDIAAAEREACARLCDSEATVYAVGASEAYQEGRSAGAVICARAIRARGLA